VARALGGPRHKCRQGRRCGEVDGAGHRRGAREGPSCAEGGPRDVSDGSGADARHARAGRPRPAVVQLSSPSWRYQVRSKRVFCQSGRPGPLPAPTRPAVTPVHRHDVCVVRHQAIGQHLRAIKRPVREHAVQVRRAILVGKEHLLGVVAPFCDMVRHTRQHQRRPSRHTLISCRTNRVGPVARTNLMSAS
jgi:hypothetical protein